MKKFLLFVVLAAMETVAQADDTKISPELKRYPPAGTGNRAVCARSKRELQRTGGVVDCVLNDVAKLGARF